MTSDKEVERLKEIKRLVEKFDCSSSCDFNTYDCDNCRMFQCQGACNYGIKRHILDLIHKEQGDYKSERAEIKTMIHRHSIQITSPVSYEKTDVVKLSNGKTIVYYTNYLHNKPTDKLVRVFNKMGEWIWQKYEVFKNGRKERLL